MLQVGNVLVHEDIIKEQFVCHLTSCKGACCVQGDAGAPLELDELATLSSIYPNVKSYLTEKGIKAIEAHGTYVKDQDGDFTTTCVNGNKECAFAIFEQDIAACGIEKAWIDHLIDYKKPISCHLYPIRVTHYPKFDVLNFDRWGICSSACSNGKNMKTPLYKFLKEPLIRAYRSDWYRELEEMIEALYG